MPEEAYRQDVESVFQNLQCDRNGLSSEEAARRRERYGSNTLQASAGTPAWKILLSQFQSFIVYVLLFAVVFATMLGEYADSVIIVLILAANAVIGFFQEYSAERSLEALKKLRAAEARVLRDGNAQTVDAADVVPGDVILLEAGRRVPADARIFDEMGLRTEEGSLTGESVPVEKHARTIQAESLPADQLNMVFSSTSVVQGSGRAVVTATAADTEIGKIAALVSGAEKEMTPLQKRLDRFGQKLGWAVVAVCLVVFAAMSLKELLAGQLTTATGLAFALVAVSLAVAAVPTALPTVVTVALSIGVKRLLARKALVRRLSSVETLGSCDIICTDKTGTLTKNEMTVRSVWTPDGAATIDGSGYGLEGRVDPPPGAPGSTGQLVFLAGLVCNDAELREDDGPAGDPTEAALLVSAAKAGVASDFRREKELAFDNRRKLMTVIGRDEQGERVAYTKGAADRLLERCTRALVDGQEVPLDGPLRDTIVDAIEERAGRALRVLGFARSHDIPADAGEFRERDLVFIGLQAMIDPPRPEAGRALQRAKAAGIRVLMLTGDHAATARAVAREIGIDDGGDRVVTGTELEEMSVAQIETVLVEEGTSVFARVSPEHKLKIVQALENRGHTVAMTGDGVNDAPALKKADIGVALGSGTEVARESGDFILLDDGFDNIVGAIEEGRGIYDNIQKSIMLLLSGNLGEVLIIFLAVLFGFNLPLTAIMLLWINLVTDGAPALAFSVDPYGSDIMRRPPLSRSTGLLPRPHLMLLGFLGTVGSLLGLGLFAYYGGNGDGAESQALAQTMAFNFVVLYELLLVFVIRREYRVPLRSNGWLWFSVVFSIAIQALILYTPLREYFGTTAPGPLEWAGLAVGGFAFAIAYVFYSLVFLRGRRISNFADGRGS